MIIASLLFMCLVMFKIKWVKDGSQDFISLQSTNSVKGICALVVVLHHCAQLVLEQSIVSKVFWWIGPLPVGLFFFYSGYGVAKSLKTKSGYIQSFFAKRIGSLVTEYGIFILIYWVYSIVINAPYSVKDVAVSLFNGYPIVTDSWYIIAILFFYVLFYFAAKLFRNDIRKVSGAMLVGYLLWIAICTLANYQYYWYHSSVSFPLGIFFAAYEDRFRSLMKKYYKRLVVIFAGAFLLLMGAEALLDTTGFADYLLAECFCCVFVFLVQLCMVHIRTENRLWGLLAKCSLEVYLIHRIFIQVFRGQHLYIKNDFLWIAAVCSASILCAVMLHKLCVSLYALLSRVFSGHRETLAKINEK